MLLNGDLLKEVRYHEDTEESKKNFKIRKASSNRFQYRFIIYQKEF